MTTEPTHKFVHLRVNVPIDTDDYTLQGIIDDAIIDALHVDPQTIIEGGE